MVSSAITDFLLTQELPALEEAVEQATESLKQPCDRKECPHLLEILPTELKLEMGVLADAQRKVVIQHPVHALHLASQVDNSESASSVWYGDEQERTMVLQTPGFGTLYHRHLKPFEKKGNDPPRKSTTNSKEKSAATAASTTTTTVKEIQPAVAKPTTTTTAIVVHPQASPAVPPKATGTTSQPVPATIPPATVPIPSLPPPPLTTPSSAVPPPLRIQPTLPDKATIPKAPTTTPAAASVKSSATIASIGPKSQSPSPVAAVQPPLAAPTQPTPVAATKPSPAAAIPPPSLAAARPTPSGATQPPPSATTQPPPTADQKKKEQLQAWFTSQQQIRRLSKAFLSKRSLATTSNKKAKRKLATASNLENLPAYKDLVTSQPSPLPEVSASAYHQEQEYAQKQTQIYMEHFRHSRTRYWNSVKQQREESLHAKNSSTTSSFQSKLTPTSVFGAIRQEHKVAQSRDDSDRTTVCSLCSNTDQADDMQQLWGQGINYTSGNRVVLTGDNLLQCLECSFVGCAPSSVCSLPTKECLWRHCLETNHKISVSCGPKAQIYCFQCGAFVNHDVFEQEKERIDLYHCLPWMAWTEYPVQRSFDALRFFHVKDQGIFWKGMHATYPMLVPKHHISSARLCLRRHVVFHGNVDRLPESASDEAKKLAQQQHDVDPTKRFSIPAPVGIYNLGNTCFMSAVIQCLIHCAPLQKYFLNSIGHNHESCALYQPASTQKPASKHSSLVDESAVSRPSRPTTACLACELDKLFLHYLSSSKGIDVQSALSMDREASPHPVSKGEPLVISDMLTSAWMCKGMAHIAGYAQRDAQEFYLAFMETLGHQARILRQRVHKMINSVRPNNSFVDHDDVDEISNLFQGTLRSVLVCKDCGNKRTQSESFMNISLPLSKEVKMATESSASSPGSRGKLSVERCLEHFTLPEFLSDPVDCPACKKKTPTKKQHVVSKLPKILCLHLKRFNGAEKKIEDFVSFPSTGLNMGKYLPHWCEVSRVPSTVEGDHDQADATMPEVLYDLFATVNHFGNLQSGHYVTNVKVDQRWYHVNDAQVEYAGIGNGEAEVLRKEGAYLLFYVRR